jgi:L-threonylcarbamoyladenylate synthase
VKEIPPNAMKLAEAFWPGPLTLLLPKKSIIPQSVTSGSHLVAVRIPNHSVTLSLLKQLEFPLVAPSANPYTRISPTNSKMVYDYFGDALPCILEGDICSKGIESTIVGFHENTPIIYRQGAISVDAIEFIAGKSKVQATKKEKVTTPGMSPMHYAPKTKFCIVDSILDFIYENRDLKIGALTIGKLEVNLPNTTYINLSIAADLEEASTNLYRSIYELDSMGLDCIIIEQFPEIGIGKSLNDRILRASFR